jgi:UDP-N-acetylmuramyl tripeptide synthase
MLRRGLAVGPQEADVVLVNNIAADHLGEWGVQNLDMLADTKFVIRHAGRHVVINAEDEKSVERAHLVEQPLTWFSLNLDLPHLKKHIASGGKAATLQEGNLCWTQDEETEVFLSASEVPMTLHGAAKHNVANALAAISVAKELGIPDSAIRQGLRSFQSNVKDNPGRMNQFDVKGISVFVDFAHNPHGLSALFEMTANLPSKRRLVTLGHAGDRNDENLKELARTAAASGVDCILLKEQPKNLRGRKLGEVPRIIH